MGRRLTERDGDCGDAHAALRSGGYILPVPLDGRALRGDLDIRVAACGTWLYNRSPLKRQTLICQFATMLARAADGRYWLVTPNELGRIDVEDAPLLAVDHLITGAGPNQLVHFCTNVDRVITVTPLTPLVVKPSPVTGRPMPYVIGADGLEARITCAAYRRLTEDAARACKGSPATGVWSGGAFFPLGACCFPDA